MNIRDVGSLYSQLRGDFFIILLIRNIFDQGQFVKMPRQMLDLALISAKELELPTKFHGVSGPHSDWQEIKSQVQPPEYARFDASNHPGAG